MQTKIEIPKLPEEIRNAVNKDNLVVFNRLYMLGLEDLEETSIMKQIISREDNNQLSEIIDYIRTLKKHEYDDKSNKIKNLWRVLFEVLNKYATDRNYQQMIVNIGEWLGLIDDIDQEAEEWVKFTIDHTNEAWELSFFVENLVRHVEKEPQRVADIYMYLLDKKIYPDFPEENIIELVEKLFLKNEVKKATIICTKYLKAGSQILIPIFQQYHQ